MLPLRREQLHDLNGTLDALQLQVRPDLALVHGRQHPPPALRLCRRRRLADRVHRPEGTDAQELANLPAAHLWRNAGGEERVRDRDDPETELDDAELPEAVVDLGFEALAPPVHVTQPEDVKVHGVCRVVVVLDQHPDVERQAEPGGFGFRHVLKAAFHRCPQSTHFGDAVDGSVRADLWRDGVLEQVERGRFGHVKRLLHGLHQIGEGEQLALLEEVAQHEDRPQGGDVGGQHPREVRIARGGRSGSPYSLEARRWRQVGQADNAEGGANVLR
mmetsp:Transcript_96891/g.269520  ORF Transcript_96891/g.269520 Transcript_96891/m.269520 type:complete len:274 (-) Transcript_96891:162-983(-)